MAGAVKLLNIEINSISKTELLNVLQEGVIYTPNVDHLVKLQRDKEFYEAYKQADFLVCDSRIVSGVSRFLGTPIREVIAGSDLLSDFCLYHANNHEIKVFLLGASEGVGLAAMKNINEKVGRNIVVGAHSPSYGFEKNDDECNDIINIINASDANVLVVGVGAPKQEKWITRYKDKLPGIKVFMGLGATIDFEAGNIKRAPLFIQKIGFEWSYRLLKEPRRLWRRYLIDDLPFFLFILKQKLQLYKNPFHESVKNN